MCVGSIYSVNSWPCQEVWKIPILFQLLPLYNSTALPGHWKVLCKHCVYVWFSCFNGWWDYSWALLIFLPVNMLIHTLSSKRTSHHPQTPCCLSPPIFSHYMWEATSESAYYALKCFISVSVLVVPFPPHAYQVLIHSNFESCLIEKKSHGHQFDWNVTFRSASLKHSHHWFSDFLSHRWTSSTWAKYSLVTWTAEITSSRGRCSWWVVWQCEWGLNTS